MSVALEDLDPQPTWGDVRPGDVIEWGSVIDLVLSVEVREGRQSSLHFRLLDLEGGGVFEYDRHESNFINGYVKLYRA